MAECQIIEPCHDRDCDGYDEVLALLPPGRIWNPSRGGVYGNYIRALGDIKTELNKRICQEYRELNPCTADRLLAYWAGVYSLPPCVPQTAEKLCEWIALLQGDCPIGSLGFLRRAIEFVAPGKGITIDVTYPDIGANCPCPDSPCADNNPLVVTAPPAAYFYETVDIDGPVEWQDGENCRVYFIPEIECLRPCIFPFGLGVGYKTDPIGPDGQDIYGVPVANESVKPKWQRACTTEQNCEALKPVTIPANAPFVNTGIEGSTMAITHGTFGGTAPITLAASGIPAGVTFADNGNGSYTLTGTWPAAGTYTYTVTATNAAGSTPLAGNQLISTAGAIAPIAPATGPFTDTGVAGTAI